jgi:hypothetical protein
VPPSSADSRGSRMPIARRGPPKELAETRRRAVAGGISCRIVSPVRLLGWRPPARAAAHVERRGIDSGVIRCRHRVSLEPGVGTEAVRSRDSNHEVPPPAVRRFPGLQHDRVDQAALPLSAEGAPYASLSLDREERRRRGGERRIEALSGQQATRASCRAHRPPGGAQVCGMQAVHRRSLVTDDWSKPA